MSLCSVGKLTRQVVKPVMFPANTREHGPESFGEKYDLTIGIHARQKLVGGAAAVFDGDFVFPIDLAVLLEPDPDSHVEIGSLPVRQIPQPARRRLWIDMSLVPPLFFLDFVQDMLQRSNMSVSF